MQVHVDNTAKKSLDALRRRNVVIDGNVCEIVLSPPKYDTVVRGLLDPQDRDLRERTIVKNELVQILEVNGEPTRPETAYRVLDDRRALDTILRARATLYLFVLDQGRISVVCPQCGVSLEITPAFYWLTVGLPQVRVTDRSFIATPALARPSRRSASRPADVPCAARIDFVLPSARLGLAAPNDVVRGTIGDLEPSREAEAWSRWAAPQTKQPAERPHYKADHAGFRAMLRLAVALADLRTDDGQLVEPTPEVVANMYLADVQFLDLLYIATHDTAGCTVHCSCGQAYLAVR